MTRSVTVRSAYMARLRRAFLLRVHPDRFRSAVIRAQQARLIQALSQRMSQPDFIAWQQQQQQHVDAYHRHSTGAVDTSSYPFVLEKRDGSLFQNVLIMNASVDSILSTIIQGLKEVGASLPEPPPPQAAVNKATRRTTRAAKNVEQHNHMHNAIHNNQNHAGRSLQKFLSVTNQQDEIQKRRNSRVDAQAAALAVRRLYRFQAIDATPLGWSSAWVATLFRRLLDLHASVQRTTTILDSFYPLRLVFSNAAAKVSIIQDQDHALDVFGGVIRLSPAGTCSQWLESLGSVTSQRMEEIEYHQSQLLSYSKIVASALGIKVKKGHTCSNVEYYAFLERLSKTLHVTKDIVDTTAISSTSLMTTRKSSSFPLAKQPIVMTIESSLMCRRPLVTPEGQLRLGSFMDPSTVLRALTELGPIALQRHDEHVELLEQQKELIQQAQHQLGLQNVYYATGTVTPVEFGNSLERLLLATTTRNRTNQDDGRRQLLLQERLGGNSLGIAGSDRFCHLADDGSLVIPHNWV